MKRLAFGAGAGAFALLLALGGMPSTTRAADHNDPPMRSGDQPADIADFYAWHDGDNINVVLSVAGASTPAADQSGTYDADVLFGVHFSNTGASGDPAYSATHDTWVRFGQNGAGEWGIQVSGLPGESGAVEGAVETALTGTDGGRVWVGLADDPFFFDLQGYTDTVTTGNLSFASLAEGGSPRDSLAGTNATVIVLQFPASAVVSEDGVVHTWVTSSRISS